MIAQILFAFGGACFPLGLYWEIEHPDAPALWFTFIILGATFWICAVIIASKKDKEERLEREKQAKEFRKLFRNIHKELQKLNQGKQ